MSNIDDSLPERRLKAALGKVLNSIDVSSKDCSEACGHKATAGWYGPKGPICLACVQKYREEQR
jgi:hypothetical protein